MADGPSLSARVLQVHRVGFGVTTMALVGLASASTGLLVSHVTRQLQPPAQHALPPAPTTPSLTPVLVDRAPGSFELPSSRTVRTVRVVTVVSTSQPAPGSVTPPVVVPPATPPVVTPPVPPPVVAPPPVVVPPVVTPSVKGKKAHPAHPAHPDDNGKHLGQNKH